MSTQSYEQLVAGANLIRQNELPESNTHTLVGEQMLQMVNKQQEADDSSRSEMYNVSRYHVNTDGTPVFTLDKAIALVPARLRVGGCVIKFQSDNGEVIAYFNGSNIASWSNVSEWRVFISDKDFQLAEKTANKNQANGYPGLDGTGKLLKAQLPDTYQPISEKGRANGYPSLDAAGDIPDAQIPNTVERTSNKNQANGYPGLDGTGKLLKAQLPDTYQTVSEKGRANGYPALDATGAIPDAQIPNTVERTSKKNQANGYPGLDGTGKLLKAQLPDTYQSISEKGRANGYPALDATGAIPDAQIPNTVEHTSKKNKANGYAGLDADGMLDNRKIRKAFGYKTSTANSYVLIPSHPLINFGTNNFTIEAVARIGQLYSSANNYIFASERSNPGIRMSLAVNSINIGFEIYDGTNWHRATIPTGNLSTTKYYHFICTVVDHYAYLYIDGELVAKSDECNVNLSLTNGLSILFSGLDLSRELALFRIYKRGFYQNDVDYYYNAGRPDYARLTYSDKINNSTTGCVVELLPENATSNWLETQNSLVCVASGDISINYGNVVPDIFFEPFKRFIGLERQGDGTGIVQYRLKSSKSGNVIIRGGVFCNDINGSNIIGNSVPIYKGIILSVNIKLTSAIGMLEVDNLTEITLYSSSSNGNLPLLRVHLSELPAFVNTAKYNCKYFGEISDIRRDTKNFSISASLSNEGNPMGNYIDIPRSIDLNLSFTSSNIQGDIKDLPFCVSCGLYATTNTTIGDIKNIPETIKSFELTGSANVNGDIANIKSSLLNLVLGNGGNYTYSNGIRVDAAFSKILIRPSVGVWTSSMTDNILIDLAAQITSFVGSKTIDLTGNCGAPTPASSTARAYLSGLGATVLTN